MKWIQRQRSGSGSQNIQGEIIHVGLTYGEAKDLFMDLFEQNFYRLSSVAHATAKERVDELTENYLHSLQASAPESIENISDPGVQAAILDVQSGYARSGDQDLGQILIDLLVERTKSTTRDIYQLSLTEALGVASKLSARHFSILTTLFLVRETKIHCHTHTDFYKRQARLLAPLLDSLDFSPSDLRYLEAVGCIGLLPLPRTIQHLWKKVSPGFFAKGFGVGELPDEISQKYFQPPYSTRCLRDKDKLQIDASDSDALKVKIENDDRFTGSEKERVEQILTNLLENAAYLLSDDEISLEAQEFDPRLPQIMTKWESTNLSLSNLTVVGIALAHANLRRIAGEVFPEDVRIWIS
ncbi:LPO_1073/Vpar_1526 family protein [Actinocorallia longicatena]|uniref:Uncharacterized protein n=1 Tax=Actinocorallia longicatena TaxID=111803 RepID=A0ABP6QDT4_9ACTN